MRPGPLHAHQFAVLELDAARSNFDGFELREIATLEHTIFEPRAAPVGLLQSQISKRAALEFAVAELNRNGCIGERLAQNQLLFSAHVLVHSLRPGRNFGHNVCECEENEVSSAKSSVRRGI